ncbi:hypothetical protein [Streptomyces chartreusis]|uniref:DUF7736 domain-containing protein n=1 Tax=Streptomyces chartreusis TaxID=1969 RepID=UPI002E1966AB
MTDSRPFPLADVLSVTTPALLSRRKMYGLEDLLTYMTGDELKTWQFLRAADECAAALLEQHPFLATLQPPQGADKATLCLWLVETERVHGEEIAVAPLSDWVHQDPTAELVDRIELARLRTTDPGQPTA